MKSQGFKFVTIMRPGLLERGDKARGLEKTWAKFMSSVPVSQVGHGKWCISRQLAGNACTAHIGLCLYGNACTC